MIIKKGVNICGVQHVMKPAFDWLQEVFSKTDYVLLINSLYRDCLMNNLVGGHPKSKHLIGQAIDVDIEGIKGADLHRILGDIRKGLDDLGFQTILEENHIHIEYDPK